jgi:hypothetical protein
VILGKMNTMEKFLVMLPQYGFIVVNH